MNLRICQVPLRKYEVEAETGRYANIKVKDMSSSTSLEPSQIIREAIVDCQPDRRVYLPSKRAQKIKIRRNRKAMDTASDPRNLQEIHIPEQLKYLKGELLILSDWYHNGEKYIIMGTSNSLKELGRSQCWVMDGTFYVAQNINLNPQRVITDFEQTISSVAKEFFPDAQYKGCLIHFGQIFWRRAQKERLARKYGNDEGFSMAIRMLKSLSLAPPESVLDYYNALNASSTDNDFKKVCVW
ncbi:PREDICTED: uncharacterized protein LOC108367441 [Rhagoletis zephyria]|uniref:uncharacterized protein LOC108367441 n=1 Tax=Rhagoletis zephyria TaxID=28612 RepID=UPI000811A8A9|nr:PREDICTED: uncharacterized protein LOC108367441 [Rhagoletis zephyria]